jgi:hypothetical protein
MNTVLTTAESDYGAGLRCARTPRRGQAGSSTTSAPKRARRGTDGGDGGARPGAAPYADPASLTLFHPNQPTEGQEDSGRFGKAQGPR